MLKQGAYRYTITPNKIRQMESIKSKPFVDIISCDFRNIKDVCSLLFDYTPDMVFEYLDNKLSDKFSLFDLYSEFYDNLTALGYLSNKETASTNTNSDVEVLKYWSDNWSIGLPMAMALGISVIDYWSLHPKVINDLVDIKLKEREELFDIDSERQLTLSKLIAYSFHDPKKLPKSIKSAGDTNTTVETKKQSSDEMLAMILTAHANVGMR